MEETRTYHDPNDCHKERSIEDLLDHADYLRDERKDKEIEEAWAKNHEKINRKLKYESNQL